MSQNEKWKVPSRLALVLYLLGAVYTMVYAIRLGESYRMLLAGASFVLPAVPALYCRLFHQKPVYLFFIVFYAFTFAAAPFASVLGGYENVPYLDKILHCLSGFLFAVVGMLLYYRLKPGRAVEKSDAGIVPLFSLLFACFTALVWEIYEFILSQFGPDPQLVAQTGVTDTMTDMIVCAIGGLITALFCRRYLKSGKKELMMALFENYYTVNLRQ